MSNSNVGFKPFNHRNHGEDILNIVVNSPEKKKFLSVNGLEYFRKALNKSEPEYDKLPSVNQKLMGLFSGVTEHIVNTKINL
jgi:hypothetical protein